MSQAVYWMLECNVVPGREDDLRALMAEMVAATEANERGMLAYEWSLSEDGKLCHIFERYADSGAVLTHLKSFGEHYAARFTEDLKPTRLLVYGAPDAAVKAALAAFGPVYMLPAAGFSR